MHHNSKHKLVNRLRFIAGHGLFKFGFVAVGVVATFGIATKVLPKTTATLAATHNTEGTTITINALSTVSSATDISQVNTAMNSFLGQYNLTFTDTCTQPGYCTGNDLTNDDLVDEKQMATAFINAFSLINTGLVAATQLQSIGFVTLLSMGLYGGSGANFTNSILFSIDGVALRQPGRLEELVYHEFGHSVGYLIQDDETLRNQWISYNVPGLPHLDPSDSNYARAYYDTNAIPDFCPEASQYCRSQAIPYGFVSRYAYGNGGSPHTALQEDYGETFAAMFSHYDAQDEWYPDVSYSDLVEWIPDDPYLGSKVELMRSVIKTADPTTDENVYGYAGLPVNTDIPAAEDAWTGKTPTTAGVTEQNKDVSLAVTAADISLVTTKSEFDTSIDKDSLYFYPLGLVHYNMSVSQGNSSDVSICFDSSLSPSGLKARMYDPTTHIYSDIPNASITTGASNCNGLLLSYTDTITGSNPGVIENTVGLAKPNATIKDFDNGIILSVPETSNIVDQCSTSQTTTISGPASSDPNARYLYPLRLVNYCLDVMPSATQQVTISWQTSLLPNQVQPQKYDPNTNNYDNLDEGDYTLTQVQQGGITVLQLTYDVTDGGSLDADTDSGFIVDPITLAYPTTPAQPGGDSGGGSSAGVSNNGSGNVGSNTTKPTIKTPTIKSGSTSLDSAGKGSGAPGAYQADGNLVPGAPDAGGGTLSSLMNTHLTSVMLAGTITMLMAGSLVVMGKVNKG